MPPSSTQETGARVYLWNVNKTFTFYIFQIEIYGGNLSEEIEYSNPQKITCIIFENLFGSSFLPHQLHSYGYAPSSGENLTSKISFKSDAPYFFIKLFMSNKCGE